MNGINTIPTETQGLDERGRRNDGKEKRSVLAAGLHTVDGF